ncbi:MAG TPA: SpoIIE family protein phosphatase [Planctomycetaceae bacterium]|nr:SpoIIE family protein phosphatase [Planctomycetaceae bacterium]
MSQGQLRPLQILMVDDDQCDRRSVQRALGNRYGLVEAENAHQAMRLVDAHQPDCILLDYNIPGTNALELLDDLRLHAPVVMLTGQGDEAVAVAAMKAGALDYVSKNDFSPDSLDLAIRSSIEKSDRHRRQLESRERLQKEYRHEKERRLELEAALQVARDIQQNLLPSAAPAAAGFDIAGVCLPAEATGGDFFDYLPAADGTLGLVVGDVSGHGIGPALLAAETRAYIRALSRIGSDVGQITTTVSKLLWEDTAGHRFATLFLAWLDPRLRTLTYAGAGHCAYIVHESGDFTLLNSQCPPLGVFENTVATTSEPMFLRHGDILLLATDGLFDVRGQATQHFGKDRCIGLVHAYRSNPAEKIVDGILHAARRFAQNGPLADDLTLVVVKTL